MPLDKVIGRLVIQGKQRLEDGVRSYFGTDEDVSQRFDPNTGSNGAFVQRDEQNNADQIRVDVGNDLTDELEAGGAMELVIGNLLDFDPSEVIIDTRANQPADPKTDAIQVVTDANGGPVIERYDGAGWGVVAASSGALAYNGDDALDPTSLDGSGGQNGEVLTTDGTASGTTWQAAGGMTDGERATIYGGYA